MSNQQTFGFFSGLYLFCPAYTFAKGPSQASSLPPNSLFANAVSDLHSLDSRNPDEADPPSFETRLEPSIILQSSTFLPQTASTIDQPSKTLNAQRPPAKKPVQKESRNVSSNLLRIFLKNVIELRVFDETICRVIESGRFSTTCQAFHDWLQSFRINFKNYIRFTEIRRLYRGEGRSQMQAIFRTVFRAYIKGLGVCHALTSRRIERGSTPMHLEGLRNLPRELRII